jgi:hypothetical protein
VRAVFAVRKQCSPQVTPVQGGTCGRIAWTKQKNARDRVQCLYCGGYGFCGFAAKPVPPTPSAGFTSLQALLANGTCSGGPSMGVTHREREGTLFPRNPIGVGFVGFCGFAAKTTNPTREHWHADACVYSLAQAMLTVGDTCGERRSP